MDMVFDKVMVKILDFNYDFIIIMLMYIYFGDVLDYCVFIIDILNRFKSFVDGMIGLIFNIILVY